MKKKEQIEEEIEKTLNAFDNIESLDVNPYLITRIEAEINKSQIRQSRILTNINLLRPMILFLFLIINVFTALFFLDLKNNTDSAKQTYLSAISTEYTINHSYYSQLNDMIGK